MIKRSLACLAAFACLAFGCGGAKESVTAKAPIAVTAEQIDADPMALLPGAPIAAAYVDARALLGASYGEVLGRMGDRMVPAAEETGFLPSRDVDSAWAATYGSQGVDGLAVLRGKFDEQKLAGAVEKKAAVRGSPIVKSRYAERNVYTVLNVGIVILTAKTALVGSEPSIRRSLDRIVEGRLQRSVPSWMIETMGTTGALFAGAGDFETQPIPAEVRAQIPVTWLRNVKTAKIVGMPEAGVRVKAHLTYATPEEASAAERGLRQVETIAKGAAIFGVVPKLDGLEIKVDTRDVDVSFRVEERAIAKLLSDVQKWL